MNKIMKRLLTGVLTLATVFTALPTTAVHAAETQYWTESEERVGIVEKVMNDGSIGSTFNEGHMTVEGEDAYCIDINTGFKNGYKTKSDASTRLSDDQIADIALSLEYVKQYTASHSGISSQHAYLLRQLVVWQRLSVHLGWSCDNVRASYDEISKAVQDEVFAGAKAFVAANKGRYDCYGYIYTGEGQDLGQFFAELAVGNGKIQKSSSNTTVTNGNDCYSLSGATYGVYSDKGCTKSVATLTTNANGNTDTVELRASTYYVKETKVPKGFQLDKNVYTLTVKVGETTTLKVSDTPKVTDTLVELFKIDMETSKATPQGNASLEGAEFVWKYYDGYYTKDNLPSEPTRTWTTKTIAEKDSNDEVHYITRLADSYKVSGDSFYTQNGTICLPLGTITVEEKAAPNGYLLEGAYIQAAGSSEQIENFVKAFTKSYYSWSNTQESIEKRTAAINQYLTKSLQDLNVDTVRQDIPTSSTVTDVKIWEVEAAGTDDFTVVYSVDQTVTEGEISIGYTSAYMVVVHVDGDGNLVITQNPTISSIPTKSGYEPKVKESDGTVDAATTEEVTEFLETFFKLYPTATEKELAYYVSGNVLEPVNCDYVFSELVNPIFIKDGEQIKVSVSVKYLDQRTKATQISQFDLTLEKDSNWKIVG